MASKAPAKSRTASDRDKLLTDIQDRVLWLSIQMVHHANYVRENPDGLKVGGHQASSSSVATLMTSLYFDFMRAGDRISVKPHASPVFHAIQYLLGNLDERYLKTLRGFHGLQAYPSRTKDPDGVDFSTGSVGLGAVAPNFAALVDEYTRTHGSSRIGAGRRYISVVGDAELDEGSVWEAIAEPAMRDLDGVLWVIDLNRQSLDRIIPGIRVQAWREMFRANGWNVIDAKYGKQLQAAFALPHGELLREAIDVMPNEVYQRLLRVPPAELREWLPATSPTDPQTLARFIGEWTDHDLRDLFHNLGGHDFAMLREAFAQAERSSGPNVVFAYTLKGWMLPSVGDPQNHSVTLSPEQMEQFRDQLGIAEDDVWSGLSPKSGAGKLIAKTRKLLQTSDASTPSGSGSAVPHDLGRGFRGRMSTQQIFGLVLTDISRNIPHIAERLVTVSPDVASSTNLGGWINKVGVWSRHEKEPLPTDVARALRWEETPRGQHIELGISENNLFIILGQLGLSFESGGEMLFPIGTLYDPFVRRGLDAFVYSVYAGAKFIVVGTPSGITLAPEGGAHQSLTTPSIGMEMPELDFYEPCFGQELEWIILSALERIRLRERSTYLRLTSMRVDQSLFAPPEDPEERERLRRQVLAGAYRLVDRRREPGYQPNSNVVHIMASGAVVPEAVEAGHRLNDEGIMANVINVTGSGPLYSRFQESVRAAVRCEPAPAFMSDVIAVDEREAPIVTVVDGHPHSLAWVGSALNTRTLPLGVTSFGQSGSRSELYREYEIDAASIMAACFAALES